ncbi:MAG: zf-TFIIB domain-containing protein [Nanoarchaeota archaeon]|nr:zf-TFIIB domain-containing protein [Nanoarchaeota archaeon]
MKHTDICPSCKTKLHKGEHKYSDGIYEVNYCKKCGYRREEPAE